MAHRRGSIHRGQTRRRNSWGFGPGDSATLFTSSASTAVGFIGSGIGPTIDGLTIARTRGSFQAWLTQAGLSEGYSGAIGIGVVPQAAFVAGIASVPTPLTELDWDGWLFHRFFQLHTPVAADFTTEGTMIRFEVDSKAMRKLNEDQIAYCAIEATE